MKVKDIRVRDVMTKDPFTIDPEARLTTAMEYMKAKKVRHLPVVDDDGQLVGIITDRDLRHAAFAPHLAEQLSLRAQRRLRGLAQALEDLRVKDAMTWVVVTTHPDATIAHAALLMFERRLGSLPVVDQGKLVGILTERDILKALAQGHRTARFTPEHLLW
jgi:acetoin utilization protein AcuB